MAAHSHSQGRRGVVGKGTVSCVDKGTGTLPRPEIVNGTARNCLIIIEGQKFLTAKSKS